MIQQSTSREAIQSAEALAPTWGDAKTVYRIFGISRSPLYRLLPLIKSASLRDEGSARGKRLFHLPSIAELLESRATGGTAPR